MISPAQAKRNADSQRAVNEGIIVFLSIVLLVLEFGIPVFGVWQNMDVPPIPGFILVIASSIVLLKLISYVHCNWDLRQVSFLQITLHATSYMSQAFPCLFAVLVKMQPG